jgi:hypothetical protein
MVIMHNIQKVCLFIYFVIIIYISMEGGGWMVKAWVVTKKVKVP